MTVEDLAIGDWVQAVTYILDGEERLTPPAYVSAIDQSGSVSLMFDPEDGDPDEYDIEAIRPIPLTAEILTKTGFDIEEVTIYSMGEIRSFDNLCICRHCVVGQDFKTSENYVCVIKLPILHVHQLQHVMRMIGIDRDIWL